MRLTREKEKKRKYLTKIYINVLIMYLHIYFVCSELHCENLYWNNSCVFNKNELYISIIKIEFIDEIINVIN